MSDNTIANRYARALADVIIERREINEVVAELEQFAKLMGGHEQLRDVFASPVISLDRKRGVLKELLARLELRPTCSNFLQLMVENGRLHNLDQILRALTRDLNARSNIVSAEVTTARNITEQEKTTLRDKLKAATGKDVRLEFKTDAGIIGGVVTRIGSLVYDGSIKNQLNQMREKLISAN